MIFKTYKRIDNGCMPTVFSDGQMLSVNYVKGGGAYNAVLNCGNVVTVESVQRRGFCNQTVDFANGTLRLNGHDVNFYE